MSDKEESDKEFSPLTFPQAKSMVVSKLRSELKKRGINSSGSKKKLVNRVKYYCGRGFPPSPKKSNKKQSGRKRKFDEIDEEEKDNPITSADQPLKKRRLNDLSATTDTKEPKDDDIKGDQPEPELVQDIETKSDKDKSDDNKNDLQKEEPEKEQKQQQDEPDKQQITDNIVKSDDDIVMYNKQIETGSDNDIQKGVTGLTMNTDAIQKDVNGLTMDIKDKQLDQFDDKQQSDQFDDKDKHDVSVSVSVVDNVVADDNQDDNKDDIDDASTVSPALTSATAPQSTKQNDIADNNTDSPFTKKSSDKEEMDVDDAIAPDVGNGSVFADLEKSKSNAVPPLTPIADNQPIINHIPSQLQSDDTDNDKNKDADGIGGNDKQAQLQTLQTSQLDHTKIDSLI